MILVLIIGPVEEEITSTFFVMVMEDEKEGVVISF